MQNDALLLIRGLKSVIWMLFFLFTFIPGHIHADEVLLADEQAAARIIIQDALNTYHQNDYSTDNWDVLVGIKNSGDIAIDAALDSAEVLLVYTTALTDMARVIPDLANARAAALDVLAAAFTSYLEGNYTPEDWILLVQFKTDGDAAIAAVNDLAAIPNAQAVALDGMASFVTDIDAIKTSAHTALTNAFNLYPQPSYTEGNWAILVQYKTDGDLAIDAALSLAEVVSAKTAALDGMAQVVVDLADAKTAAHTAVADAFARYGVTDYTPEKYTILGAFKTDGDAAIDAASDVSHVSLAQVTALDGMTQVVTIAQTLALAKTAAHTAVSDAFNTHSETRYTPEDWLVLTGFKTDGDIAIELSATEGDVAIARDRAIADINTVTTLVTETATIEPVVSRSGTRARAVRTTTTTTGATTQTTGRVLGASSFRFTAPLTQKVAGESVAALQERLRAEGFFTYPVSTGYFGPITLAAVMAYQKAHGLPETGFVGDMTMGELNK